VPAFNLKRFCRYDGLACIQPTNLLRLLRPFREYLQRRGWAVPLGPTLSRAQLKSLLDVLISPDGDTPEALTDALFYIHEMSTPEGMDLLLPEVNKAECKSGWFGEFSPADVAVKAWLDDPEMLQRKHAELHVRHYRSFLYFRTPRQPVPPFVLPSAEAIRATEARLAETFVKKNRGRAAKVFAYPQEDHTVWFLIRHGDPYRRESSLKRGEPASVSYRPLRFDVAVYDTRLGELRVHAKAQWEFTTYRLEFGQCLFDDMQFFSHLPKYTLQPLRNRGPASLECGAIRGMNYIQLKEVQLLWDGPHGEVQTHRATVDLFEAMRYRRADMPEGATLVQATFAVRFADSREPRLVTIKPPNTALYGREEDAHLVDQWLTQQGFVIAAGCESRDSADQPLLASA
jgi:hypothetical protein